MIKNAHGGVTDYIMYYNVFPSKIKEIAKIVKDGQLELDQIKLHHCSILQPNFDTSDKTVLYSNSITAGSWWKKVL